MTLLVAKPITSSGEPFTARHHGKMFLLCLSYANLCFFNTWAEISDHGYDFLTKYTVTSSKVIAVALDTLIVAAAAWAILYIALASGKQRWIRTARWAALAALLIPLNVIRTDENFVSARMAYIPHAPLLKVSLVLLAVVLGVLLIIKWERLSTRIASTLLIALSPGMPLALGNAAWHVWTGGPGGLAPNRALQPALPQPAGSPHLIWILFDEWDQALTFRHRPSSLSLPEIDRFQSEAFHADRVYPPARYTVISVPSLLSGKTFIDSKPQVPNELMLTYARGRPPEALTAQSTIFSEARRRAFNVGIVGWYLPYCRMFTECTSCSWFSAMGIYAKEEFEHPTPVLHLMGQTFTRQIRKIPLLYKLGMDLDTPVQKRLHADSYRQIHDDMLRTITDPRLNLVFVHISIPHMPAIYLASKDTISASTDTTYVDNLRLLDRTIRDLRNTLEAAGMWDTSTILLTSDHPLRVRDWRPETQARFVVTQHAEVPYLLKMAGQKQGLAYEKPMQEIVTKDLLLAILGGMVTTPQEVATWIDHNPPRQ